jgi:hypothetical protein
MAGCADQLSDRPVADIDAAIGANALPAIAALVAAFAARDPASARGCFEALIGAAVKVLGLADFALAAEVEGIWFRLRKLAVGQHREIPLVEG